MNSNKYGSTIPVRKSRNEIDFYLKHGPTFNKILLEMRDQVKEGKGSLEFNFKRLCKHHFSSVGYPFFHQKNHCGETFAKIICVSPNSIVAHGRNIEPKKGDILSVDCGLSLPLNGRWIHFDSAFTCVYGMKRSKHTKWINAARTALANITKFQPKDTMELAEVIQQTALKNGLQIVVSLTGHGVGYSLHEAPAIHNAPGPFNPAPLFEGLVFCAEPIFVKAGIDILNPTDIALTCLGTDNWEVSTINGDPASHFETMFGVVNGKIIDLIGVSKWRP